MSKLRSIQVLRAVAAMAVVVHHAVHEVAPDAPARVGAAGVDLFFVISGFIMATVASRKSPAEFLADRAWRIFPLWIVALIPWLAIKHPDLSATLSSISLWPIYGNAFHEPALGVGWSLCFELLFYGAFALALARWTVLPAAVFALCLCAAPFSGSALVNYLGSPLILEFLAGVVIARMPLAERLGLPLIVLGAAWLAIAPVDLYARISGPETFVRVFYWGMPAALIVYGARSLERWFDRDAFNVLVLIGNASYAIYLFHLLIIKSGLAPGIGPAIALSLVMGVAVHFLLERPLMALRRHSSRPVAEQPRTA